MISSSWWIFTDYCCNGCYISTYSHCCSVSVRVVCVAAFAVVVIASLVRLARLVRLVNGLRHTTTAKHGAQFVFRFSFFFKLLQKCSFNANNHTNNKIIIIINNFFKCSNIFVFRVSCYFIIFCCSSFALS